MDYPYIVLICILLILAYLENKHPMQSDKFFKISCCVVFVFVAFRAPVVGADTWDYYRFATRIRSFYNYDDRELEILYQWYNDFFRNYCPVGLIFMITNTLIIFSPICYLLNKFVPYKTFGVLSFFLFIDFSPFFVALRQLLSLSIILWAVIYVLNDKRYKWIVFVGLSTVAYFMHTTAVVVASLFLLSYILPLSKRIIPIILIISSAVVGILLKSFNILDVFNIFLSFNFSATERVSGYLESEELNEMGALNLVLRMTIIAILAFSFIPKEKINHWFTKIFLVGVVLYNLFCTVPMISRMIMANTLFVIFVLPWMFENRFTYNPAFKKFFNIIMLLVVLYFTRAYVIGNTDYDLHSLQRMHPYYFFFEDYYNHPSIKYFK